jgi:hypothetical protein
VTFVGRLATYRYYNMDQIVGQALATFRRIPACEAAGGRQVCSTSAVWTEEPPNSGFQNAPFAAVPDLRSRTRWGFFSHPLVTGVIALIRKAQRLRRIQPISECHSSMSLKVGRAAARAGRTDSSRARSAPMHHQHQQQHRRDGGRHD